VADVDLLPIGLSLRVATIATLLARSQPPLEVTQRVPPGPGDARDRVREETPAQDAELHRAGQGELDRVYRRPQSFGAGGENTMVRRPLDIGKAHPVGGSPTPCASSGDSPQAFAPGTMSL
jgi:hypothetical protein